MSFYQKPERVWNDPPMPGEGRKNPLKGIRINPVIAGALFLTNVIWGIVNYVLDPTSITHLTAFNGVIDLQVDPPTKIIICIILWGAVSILLTPIIEWEWKLFNKLCGGGK